MKFKIIASLDIVWAVALMAVKAIVNGYVLSVLWRWFVVPALGLPQISLAAAIGIGLLISFLTEQHIENESEDRDLKSAIGKAIGIVILYPAIVLFIGWIVHLFM